MFWAVGPAVLVQKLEYRDSGEVLLASNDLLLSAPLGPEGQGGQIQAGASCGRNNRLVSGAVLQFSQAGFILRRENWLRTPNKTEKRSKRQQGRKKPNGYQPCVHIGRAGACIDGTRQRFAQQPSGAFQDERNCPPHVWQCGALYVSWCTPVCKTENRTLYQREVSEDDKRVSRANFAGTADDPAYIPTFCNHSHCRQ